MTRVNVRPIGQQLGSFVNCLFFLSTFSARDALNELHYSRLLDSFEIIR